MYQNVRKKKPSDINISWLKRLIWKRKLVLPRRSLLKRYTNLNNLKHVVLTLGNFINQNSLKNAIIYKENSTGEHACDESQGLTLIKICVLLTGAVLPTYIVYAVVLYIYSFLKIVSDVKNQSNEYLYYIYYEYTIGVLN